MTDDSPLPREGHYKYFTQCHVYFESFQSDWWNRHFSWPCMSTRYCYLVSFWMVLSPALQWFPQHWKFSRVTLQTPLVHSLHRTVFSDTMSKSSGPLSFSRFSSLSFQTTVFHLDSCFLHCTWELGILIQNCSVHSICSYLWGIAFVAWCTASCLIGIMYRKTLDCE